MTTVSMSGHWWTVGPRLRSKLAPAEPPPSRRFRTSIEDPKTGRVELSGWLTEPAGATDLVVVLHGLGGCSDSPYAVETATRAQARGVACLRYDFRGADLQTQDFYHAGLTSDLHAALASPELEAYESIYLLGYSLGGHLALKAATEDELDPRVVRAAAVCAPLDLKPCAYAFDESRNWLYRRYLMAGLRRIYEAVAERRPVPLAVEEMRRIRSIVEWDERIVAPRFEFDGALDYYATVSVASRLERLRVPALLVTAPDDPLVPFGSIERVLDGRSLPSLDVRRAEPGGHLGFPPTLDLGVDAPVGLVPQVLGWGNAR